MVRMDSVSNRAKGGVLNTEFQSVETWPKGRTWEFRFVDSENVDLRWRLRQVANVSK